MPAASPKRKRSPLRVGERLPFLGQRQRTKLSLLLRRGGFGALMPHDLANRVGVRREHALAILTVLSEAKACRMRLLVYHVCDLEVWFMARRFGAGFPRLPLRCGVCNEMVTDRGDLLYDFEAYRFQDARLIW